jgi:hypothetical protein
MPILDYDDEFTTTVAQAITATAIGTKVKDGGAAKDWGSGEEVDVYMRVTEAFNTLTSLTVTVEGADNLALSTNPVVLATKSIALAALTLNSLHFIGRLAPGSAKRYLGGRFTVVGSNPSTGKVVMGLKPRGSGPQDGVNYL